MEDLRGTHPTEPWLAFPLREEAPLAALAAASDLGPPDDEDPDALGQLHRARVLVEGGRLAAAGLRQPHEGQVFPSLKNPIPKTMQTRKLSVKPSPPLFTCSSHAVEEKP